MPPCRKGEDKVPEEIGWMIDEWERVRPNDFDIGKDFILESFRLGKIAGENKNMPAANRHD